MIPETIAFRVESGKLGASATGLLFVFAQSAFQPLDWAWRQPSWRARSLVGALTSTSMPSISNVVALSIGAMPRSEPSSWA